MHGFLKMSTKECEIVSEKIVGLIVTEEKREAAFPFNEHWQTACLPVGNQANIERTVKQLKKEGIIEIYIVENHLPKQVKKSLKTHKEIRYLKTFEDFLSLPLNDRYFFYIKGSQYIPKKIFSTLMNKLDSSPDGVLSVSEKTAYKNASNQFGIQTKDKHVKALYGFTREHYMNYHTNGVYLINEKCLKHYNTTEDGFQNVPAGGMPSQKFHIESLIQTTIDEGFSYTYAISEESVYDLTYPWELLEVNMKHTIEETDSISENGSHKNATIHETAVIGENAQFGKNVEIGPHVIIKGKAIIGENTIVSNGAIIEENAIIGSDCLITDYAKISSGTTIGDNCKIGYTAEVSGVFFDGVSAVHNSEFFGIAGKSVDIAAACNVGSLRFDDQPTMQKIQGKKYSGDYSSGVFIGDYTRLGVGNLFYPGVRIGSNSAIGPGAIIDLDIEKNTLVNVHQEKTYSTWGPERYGWS